MGTESPVKVGRYTLGNDLRVVLVHDPNVVGAHVSVHYGVGFRTERPGEGGLAHLFEHLMTQDSQHLLPAAKMTAALAMGGLAGATTHPDYTEFHQSVPACALDSVLHWEADRMRAPRFTREHLHAQLRGVVAEIRARRDEPPFGRVPWPALPEVLYSNFANSHDGYGDVAELAGTSYEQCLAFHETHYTPSNAVLTVMADLADQADLLGRVDRYFGAVAPRPRPDRPDLREVPLSQDVHGEIEVFGERTAPVILGYRLPDPVADQHGYLSKMVLATLLRSPGIRWPGSRTERPVVASSGCGIFAPLDACDPDTMILVGRTGTDAVVDAVDGAIAAVAAGDVPDTHLAAAVSQTAFGHERVHRRPLERCGAHGRSELLFGSPDFVPGATARLYAISPRDVVDAAAALRQSCRAVLVSRTVKHVARRIAPRFTGSVDSGNRSSDSFVPRPWSVKVPKARDGVVEYAAKTGPRLVVARSIGSDVVELRLRVDHTHDHPREITASASVLRKPFRAGETWCVPRVVVLPTAVELSIAIPSVALPDWIGHTTGLLPATGEHAAVADPGGVPRERPGRDPALRHYLALQNGERPPSSPALTMVAVGDLDPERTRDLLEEHLPEGYRGIAATESDSGSVVVSTREAAERGGGVRLWSPLSEEILADPALFLVISLANGGASFRQAQPRGLPAAQMPFFGRPDPTGLSLAGAFAGVDSVGGRPSLFLSARFPADQGVPAIGHLISELDPCQGAEISGEDLEAVQALVAGRWQLVRDDASAWADLLLSTASAGVPTEVVNAPELLREVGPFAFRRMWEGLWGGEGFSGAVVATSFPDSLGHLTGRIINRE